MRQWGRAPWGCRPRPNFARRGGRGGSHALPSHAAAPLPTLRQACVPHHGPLCLLIPLATQDKLIDPSSVTRIFKITKHIGMLATGLEGACRAASRSLQGPNPAPGQQHTWCAQWPGPKQLRALEASPLGHASLFRLPPPPPPGPSPLQPTHAASCSRRGSRRPSSASHMAMRCQWTTLPRCWQTRPRCTRRCGSTGAPRAAGTGAGAGTGRRSRRKAQEQAQGAVS
jgi:hypothetical protein